MLALWSKQTCRAEITLAAAVGALRIWIGRTAGGLRVAWRCETDRRFEPLRPANAPADAAWAHYAAPDALTDVCLQPVLPDRPLIARPQTPVRLLTGHAVRFYIEVPLWVRIEASGAQAEAVTLCELPTQVLSKSWFGQPDDEEGEVCYALRTQARGELADLTRQPDFAICTLRLRNESQAVETLDRFCLHAPTLRLHSAPDGQLWTDDVQAGLRAHRSRRSAASDEHRPPSADMRLMTPSRVEPLLGRAGLALGGLALPR